MRMQKIFKIVVVISKITMYNYSDEEAMFRPWNRRLASSFTMSYATGEDNIQRIQVRGPCC